MSDEFEQQDWVKFGVAATLSKQYASDQRSFLESLAKMLESAMPAETEIFKKGGLFSKKSVSKITVSLGEYRLSLEDLGHGPLIASRVRVVRGIALKTENLPIEDWVAELSETVDERARTNRAAQEALTKFMG